MLGMNETSTTFAELTKTGVISVTDGYRAKNSELGGDGLIFLRAGHVTDAHIDFAGVERFHEKLTPKLQDKTSRVGDVIVTTKGNSTGRASFVDATMPTFVYSPHLSRWRVEDSTKVDPAFLRYWSRSPQFVNQMRGLAASTDMAPYLSLRDQQRLEITLPQIDEQRGIGEVLRSLDDKIEQNRRTGRKLEALARAVFKAWFVDFEPVKAKAAGATAFPGMPAATFAALPTRLVDSELGPVPEGWQIGVLGGVCTLKRGYDLPAAKRSPGSVPIVSSSGISGTHTEAKASGPGVITGRYGTIGQVHFVNGPYWPLNTTLYVADFKGSPPRFVYHVLSGVDFFKYIDKAAVPGVNRNHLHIEPLVNPPAGLAHAFQQFVEPLCAQNDLAVEESRKLATLRDYLLPRLLSGRIRVGEAERASLGAV
jgi:type I restriction enzyme S subunit